ncbi:hypothetical protein SprV_0200757800 [Sparganum proliferum]
MKAASPKFFGAFVRPDLGYAIQAWRLWTQQDYNQPVGVQAVARRLDTSFPCRAWLGLRPPVRRLFRTRHCS